MYHSTSLEGLYGILKSGYISPRNKTNSNVGYSPKNNLESGNWVYFTLNSTLPSNENISVQLVLSDKILSDYNNYYLNSTWSYGKTENSLPANKLAEFLKNTSEYSEIIFPEAIPIEPYLEAINIVQESDELRNKIPEKFRKPRIDYSKIPEKYQKMISINGNGNKNNKNNENINMNISKDMYEYLTNFADDRTILNMLSVNKKFNDEDFFKRVMIRKYPLLLKYKKSDETYKRFFIKNIYYIAKIKEKYDIPYFPGRYYNPVTFYNYPSYTIYETAMDWAALEGFTDIVELMIQKGANNYYTAVLEAAKGGHIDLVKFFINKGAKNYNNILLRAIEHGHLNIVKFAIQKGAKDRTAIFWANRQDNVEIIDYINSLNIN